MIKEEKLVVLYGTETGNSELISMDICKAAEALGIEAVNFGMEEINSEQLHSFSRQIGRASCRERV